MAGREEGEVNSTFSRRRTESGGLGRFAARPSISGLFESSVSRILRAEE